MLAGAGLLVACTSDPNCPFDPCEPRLFLHEHCAETGACSVDGAPVESLYAAQLARGETLAVPLAGIDWTRVKGRDLFFMYTTTYPYSPPDPETWPDPDQAQVVLDGELGSFLGRIAESGSSVYRWDAWPTSPQLLTVSYTDGTAGPVAVSMSFEWYECELAMGPRGCPL